MLLPKANHLLVSPVEYHQLILNHLQMMVAVAYTAQVHQSHQSDRGYFVYPS